MRAYKCNNAMFTMRVYNIATFYNATLRCHVLQHLFIMRVYKMRHRNVYSACMQRLQQRFYNAREYNFAAFTTQVYIKNATMSRFTTMFLQYARITTRYLQRVRAPMQRLRQCFYNPRV